MQDIGADFAARFAKASHCADRAMQQEMTRKMFGKFREYYNGTSVSGVDTFRPAAAGGW